MKDCCSFCRQKRLNTERQIKETLSRMEAEGRKDRIRDIEYQKTLKLLDLTNRSKEEREKTLV